MKFDRCGEGLYQILTKYITKEQADPLYQELMSHVPFLEKTGFISKELAIKNDVEKFKGRILKSAQVKLKQLIEKRKVLDDIAIKALERKEGLLDYLLVRMQGDYKGGPHARDSVAARIRSFEGLFLHLYEKTGLDNIIKNTPKEHQEELDDLLSESMFGKIDIASPEFKKSSYFNEDIVSRIKSATGKAREVTEYFLNLKNDKGFGLKIPKYRTWGIKHNSDKIGSLADTLQESINTRKRIREENPGEENFKQAVHNHSYQRWSNFIRPLLDQATFLRLKIDPTNEIEVDRILKGIYNSIISGESLHVPTGTVLDMITKPAIGLGYNVADANSLSSVLLFRDGASVNRYCKKFGVGDFRNQAMSAAHSNGKMIGLVDGFGTNPRHTIDELIRRGRTQSAKNLEDSSTIRRKEKKIRLAYSHLVGDVNVPVNKLFAKISTAMRDVASLAKLGSIVLGSLPDLAIKASALQEHGISFSKSWSDTIRSLLQRLSPKERREFGILTGVYNDSYSSLMHNRMNSYGSNSRLMDTFFRFTGIHFFDQVNRTSMAASLASHLANLSDLPYTELGPEKKILDRYGIDSEMWDIMRDRLTSPLESRPSLKMITPDFLDEWNDAELKGIASQRSMSVRDLRADWRVKLQNYFTDRSDTAIIRPDIKDRSLLVRDQPGTLWGEFQRHMAHFHTFNIAYANRVLGGWGLYNKSMRGNLMQMMTISVIMGYGINVVSDLLKGRKPDDITSSRALLRAMLRGNSFPIITESLLREYGFYGNTFSGTFLPVTAPAVDDIATIMSQIIRGKNPAKAAINLARNITPGSNLPYTSAIFNYFFNSLTSYFT